MIHQPLAGMQGTAEEIMIHRKELRRVKAHLNELIAHHTGKTVDEIEANTDRDNFMSSEEAREFNLIDRVVASIAEAQAQA
jgi:ATP-dependent Clp protease protease subunit